MPKDEIFCAYDKTKRSKIVLNHRLVSTPRTCLCVAGTKQITQVNGSRDSKGDWNYVFLSLLETDREVKHKIKEKRYESLIEIRTIYRTICLLST